MDEQKIVSRIEALERKVNDEITLNKNNVLSLIINEIRRLQEINDSTHDLQEIHKNAKCISHLALAFAKTVNAGSRL